MGQSYEDAEEPSKWAWLVIVILVAVVVGIVVIYALTTKTSGGH